MRQSKVAQGVRSDADLLQQSNSGSLAQQPSQNERLVQILTRGPTHPKLDGQVSSVLLPVDHESQLQKQSKMIQSRHRILHSKSNLLPPTVWEQNLTEHVYSQPQAPAPVIKETAALKEMVKGFAEIDVSDLFRNQKASSLRQSGHTRQEQKLLPNDEIKVEESNQMSVNQEKQQEKQQENLGMSQKTRIKFNEGLQEIMALNGQINDSTEKDKKLGAELESQIDALEKSYENLTTLKHVPTDLDLTGDTETANRLAAHFSKEDTRTNSLNNVNQESSDGDRVDLQDLDNLYVNFASKNPSPKNQQPQAKYQVMLASQSDNQLNIRQISINNQSILPDIQAGEADISNSNSQAQLIQSSPIKPTKGQKYRGKAALRKQMPMRYAKEPASQSVLPYHDEGIQGQEILVQSKNPLLPTSPASAQTIINIRHEMSISEDYNQNELKKKVTPTPLEQLLINLGANSSGDVKSLDLNFPQRKSQFERGKFNISPFQDYTKKLEHNHVFSSLGRGSPRHIQNSSNKDLVSQRYSYQRGQRSPNIDHIKTCVQKQLIPYQGRQRTFVEQTQTEVCNHCGSLKFTEHKVPIEKTRNKKAKSSANYNYYSAQEQFYNGRWQMPMIKPQ